MNLGTLRLFALIIPIVLTANGCTTAVVAGAAAAGGYFAYEKGYRLRNPITRPGGEEQEDY